MITLTKVAGNTYLYIYGVKCSKGDHSSYTAKKGILRSKNSGLEFNAEYLIRLGGYWPIC